MDHSELTGNYNVYLVVLSYMIAVMSSFTALDMARRVTLSEGWKRRTWLMGGAVAMGVGIWAMHFVAMLAFQISVTVTYNTMLVLVSIAVAIVASLGGLYAASRSTFSLQRFLVGGVFMGGAIGGMHYIGMGAMEGVSIRYSSGLFALSIVIAVSASLVALLLAFRFRDNLSLFMHLIKIGSGIIMGFGIIGMHYIGMAAATFTESPTMPNHSNLALDPSVLAVYIAIGSMIVLKIVLISSYFADKRLAEQVAFNGSILESAVDCILMVDADGNITQFNPAVERTFGYGRAELLRKKLDQLIVLSKHPMYGGIREFLALLVDGVVSNRFETYALHTDGYEFAVELTVTRVKNHGTPQYTAYIRDITERKQVEEALKESEERYRRLVDFSPEAIIVHRNGKIIFANEAAARTVGVANSKHLVGRSVYEWVEDERKEDITKWLHAIEYAEEDVGPMEIRITRFDGETIDIEANSILIQNEGKSFIQTIARDITEKKRADNAIKQMAYYDVLTGLPNRNLFNDRVSHSLSLANTHQLHVGIMFIDLDRFKHINDTLGHPVGDLLLKELAYRLTESVRDTDTISRLGGDEFIVLLPNTTHEQAAIVALRMMANIAKPFIIQDQTIFVTASIGIALYPDDGDTPELLIKNADTAMYEAKEQGKNSYRFYNPHMNTTSSRKLELEQGLRRAVEHEQFLLHYQPKIKMDTREIVGVEALIRWQHPELGYISPNEFISLAEQSGMIVPIGEWTLRTACRQNKAWQDKGYPPMRVAVNLSMLQFRQDDLIGMLIRILRETGMSPQYLELEITESVAMHNQEKVIEKMQMIKQLGIQISIDDFGTGYSSLSNLRKYPFNTIKIDRSFVRDLKGLAEEATIIQSIIEMAHSLRMNVLAEGVETEEQIEVLRTHKCDEVQGFQLGKPLPAELFEQTLLEGKR